jgi:hypothetical protein
MYVNIQQPDVLHSCYLVGGGGGGGGGGDSGKVINKPVQGHNDKLSK